MLQSRPVNPGPGKAKLRVGIICNGLNLQWFHQASLRRVLDLPEVQPVLVIVDDKPMERQRSALGSIFTRRLERWGSLEAAAELEAIPKIYGAAFSKAEAETIRTYELDFILHFGSGILRGDILSAARYGIWSYRYDNPVLENKPVSSAVLQRLTEEPEAGIVLRKCFLKTVPYQYENNAMELR